MIWSFPIDNVTDTKIVLNEVRPHAENLWMFGYYIGIVVGSLHLESIMEIWWEFLFLFGNLKTI